MSVRLAGFDRLHHGALRHQGKMSAYIRQRMVRETDIIFITMLYCA